MLHFSIRKKFLPWLLWISGLSTRLRTKESLVRFPVRELAWVVGQVPSRRRMRGNYAWMFLFLSFSLPSPVSKNREKKRKEKKKEKHSGLSSQET